MIGDSLREEMTMKKEFTDELMKAIRALDDKGKVVVLDAFVAFYDTESM